MVTGVAGLLVEDPVNVELAETVVIATVCADVYVPGARLKAGAGAVWVIV
jgi:hypothetical protein